MPKRKCFFQENYSEEWSFIKQGRSENEAECKICQCYISIAHGGRTDITKHIGSVKHKSRMYSANTSRTMDNYFLTKSSEQGKLVAATELTMCYHIVKHHMSFKSMDCISKLNSKLFKDSQTAQNVELGRTKTTAIVKSVLAPDTTRQLCNELAGVHYFGIATDASNHNAEKIFPLIVQYFTPANGMTVKLLKLGSLPNETSSEISKYCIEALEENNIDKNKCIAFCGDNANCNFGGIRRAGTNNVFARLKSELNENLLGIGCPAHIIHNSVKTAADVLSVDVETTIIKLFNYFSIYTVRTERLKEFCEFVELEYHALLSHTKTRWLSLLAAVDRVLKLYDALQSFFLSEEKAPKVLLTLFQNPLSEPYLWFVHSQMSVFERQILKLEKTDISVIEVAVILKDTLRLINERKEERFIPIKVKSILKRIENEVSTDDIEKLYAEVDEFYETSAAYLQKWMTHLNEFSTIFTWMLLDSKPEWTAVQGTLMFLQDKGVSIDDSLLFDQFTYLKEFIELELCKNGDRWNSKSCQEKWTFFLRQCKCADQYSQLLHLCEFIFSVPGHNANVERIFSLMNVQWTDERNRLHVATVEAIMKCVFNYKLSCTEFYDYVIQRQDLLTQSLKSDKYEMQPTPT